MGESIIYRLGRRFSRPYVKTAIERKKTDEEKDLFADKEFIELVQKVRPFTMTSELRMYGLYLAVRNIVENEIEGDFVECGVWKGGSSMLVALILQQMGVSDRKLFLYDTFEGMSENTKEDVDIDNQPATDLLENADKENNLVWCYSSLEEVKANLALTGYPANMIEFVEGKVEDTIPNTIPDKIALLRLDTDWYESTRHEMLHLYPRLQSKGVLIVDDYGHWQGARKAIDDYLSDLHPKPLLTRLDYTGRMAVKP